MSCLINLTVSQGNKNVSLIKILAFRNADLLGFLNASLTYDLSDLSCRIYEIFRQTLKAVNGRNLTPLRLFNLFKGMKRVWSDHQNKQTI